MGVKKRSNSSKEKETVWKQPVVEAIAKTNGIPAKPTASQEQKSKPATTTTTSNLPIIDEEAHQKLKSQIPIIPAPKIPSKPKLDIVNSVYF